MSVLLALAASFLVAQAQDSGVAGNSRIVGKITAADGKTSVPGATVIAFHLSTEEFFYSAASNAKGEYQISGLPAGYYDMAVRMPEGLFVGNSVVNVTPARKAIADFSVVPLAALSPGDPIAERVFPGSQGQVTGSARVDKRLTNRDFWRGPKGIAILATGGAAVLLAVVTSGDDEQIVSPF